MSRLTAACTLLLVVVGGSASAAIRRTQWMENSGYTDNGNYSDMVRDDLDHDGHVDIVLMATTYMTVARGKGDGTFATPQSVIPNQTYDGRQFRSFSVADFTGDGYDDLLVADYGIGRLLLAKNNGDGTFAAAVPTPLPLLPYEMAAGDFNGDGRVDIVVTTWETAELILFTGNGDGTFVEGQHTPILGYQTVGLFSGDIDHDGHLDVAVSRYTASTLEIYFGRGDGSFEKVVLADAGQLPHAAVRLADLNGDGYAEVVAGNWDDDTVTVNMNNGGRAFAAPVAYSVRRPNAVYGENPVAVAVADYNGDGFPDVAVACVNGGFITVLHGAGDGTLGNPVLTYVRGGPYNRYATPRLIEPADFDEDGRIDLVVFNSSSPRVSVELNKTGKANIQVTAPAVVTIGQDSTAKVTVSPAVDITSTPRPTGEVTISERGSPIATVALTNGSTTATVPGSTSLADRRITVSYGGDSNYDALETTVIQLVTPETTTTTATLTATDPPYGARVRLDIKVTSSTGDTPGGLVVISTPESAYPLNEYLYSGATSEYISILAGAHTITVDYAGDSTHPPSRTTVTYTSAKAQPGFRWYQPPLPLVMPGAPLTVRVTLTGTIDGTAPTGTITFMDGSTPLGSTATTGTSPISWQFSLPAGRHSIRATYSGSDYYKPAETETVAVRALDAQGAFVLDARGSGSTVNLGWTPYPGADRYQVRLRGDTGYWYYGSSTTALSYNDSRGSGSVYVYRVEALDANGAILATTNNELGSTTSFTDDSIAPGMTIRLSQFTETVELINRVRAYAGLAALSLPQLAAGGEMRASTIRQMRSAIEEARTKLGVPGGIYSTDQVPGAVIRAADIQDIRESAR